MVKKPTLMCKMISSGHVDQTVSYVSYPALTPS